MQREWMRIWKACFIKIKPAGDLYAATIRPNDWPFIVSSATSSPFVVRFFRDLGMVMTKLRLLLLASTALTAAQFVSPPSSAQNLPQVIAQGGPPGSDSK